MSSPATRRRRRRRRPSCCCSSSCSSSLLPPPQAGTTLSLLRGSRPIEARARRRPRRGRRTKRRKSWSRSCCCCRRSSDLEAPTARTRAAAPSGRTGAPPRAPRRPPGRPPGESRRRRPATPSERPTKEVPRAARASAGPLPQARGGPSSRASSSPSSLRSTSPPSSSPSWAALLCSPSLPGGPGPTPGPRGAAARAPRGQRKRRSRRAWPPGLAASGSGAAGRGRRRRRRERETGRSWRRARSWRCTPRAGSRRSLPPVPRRGGWRGRPGSGTAGEKAQREPERGQQAQEKEKRLRPSTSTLSAPSGAVLLLLLGARWCCSEHRQTKALGHPATASRAPAPPRRAEAGGRAARSGRGRRAEERVDGGCLGADAAAFGAKLQSSSCSASSPWRPLSSGLPPLLSLECLARA